MIQINVSGVAQVLSIRISPFIRTLLPSVVAFRFRLPRPRCTTNRTPHRLRRTLRQLLPAERHPELVHRFLLRIRRLMVRPQRRSRRDSACHGPLASYFNFVFKFFSQAYLISMSFTYKSLWFHCFRRVHSFKFFSIFHNERVPVHKFLQSFLLA